VRQADAGHIAQRVLQRSGSLVTHDLLRYHVDGLWHVAQRCLGLGAAGGRRGVVGRVFGARGLYPDLGHDGTGSAGRGSRAACALHGEGAPILRAHLQAAAGQQALQRLLHFQRTAQRRRLQALGHVGEEDDLDAALAGQRVERLGQGLGRQVHGQGLGVGQAGNAQRRGQGRQAKAGHAGGGGGKVHGEIS
jgi:hypothetical protein